MYRSFETYGGESSSNKDVNHYNIVNITSKEHKESIIRSHRIVCVDVYADWCQPCRQIEGDYASLSAQYNKQGECILVKENYELGLTPNVNGIPAFYFYVFGQLRDTVIGADLGSVEKKLISLLSSQESNHPTVPSFSRNMIRNNTNVYQGHSMDTGMPESNTNPENPYTTLNQSSYGMPNVKYEQSPNGMKFTKGVRQ